VCSTNSDCFFEHHFPSCLVITTNLHGYFISINWILNLIDISFFFWVIDQKRLENSLKADPIKCISSRIFGCRQLNLHRTRCCLLPWTWLSTYCVCVCVCVRPSVDLLFRLQYFSRRWGFSVLFSQLQGKCHGITCKEEARPALFPIRR
jgi:hypothetical protein